MPCLFCRSTSVKNFESLPPNIFNNKKYLYIRCEQCKLVYIDPIPSISDLNCFYPESYQGEIRLDVSNGHKKEPGLRFSYQLHFNIIKNENCKKVLDFGCGNGHFIYNALYQDITIDGLEFNAVVINKLRAAMPLNKFYTINEFYNSSESYDIIRMSNVLEHFTEPIVEFEKLNNRLNQNGLIIVEGPVEMNRSLVNMLKWNYFILRKKLNSSYTTSHVPTHIFFSDHSNQIHFFEKAGLCTEKYILKENTWPYPESLTQIRSFGAFIKYLFAKFSIALSYFLPNYGNTFLYVGRKR